MADIYLSLGSNLGNREQNLGVAIRSFPPRIIIEQVSPVYETKPQYERNQPEFLNIACKGKTEMNPREVLGFLKHIEKSLGRAESGRFGPRIIDIDLLFYGGERINEPDLIIPHSGIIERAFVLVPLSDIAPHFEHPTLGITIRELKDKLGDTSKDVKKTSLSL